MSSQKRSEPKYAVVCKVWIYGPLTQQTAQRQAKDFDSRCMHHHTVEPFDRKTMKVGAREPKP